MEERSFSGRFKAKSIRMYTVRYGETREIELESGVDIVIDKI